MITIRKMEQDEAQAVRKIAQSAFSGVEKFFVGKPKEAMVAEIDGKIVGGIIIKYLKSKGQKIGYADTAFVDRAHQGQGVGSTLYRETTKYLWEQGCTALSAIVKDDNVGSWKPFLDNGFSRISLLEGVRQLGFWPMVLQYFDAPFFMSNGMELYLATKDGEVREKQNGSARQIALYIFANSVIALFAMLRGQENFPLFLGAYVAMLLGCVLFGFLGTKFTKERWHFRMNSGGAVISAFATAIGGLYPMIGNWYPEKYEKKKEFKKAMGVVAACEWGFVIFAALAGFILRKNHVFFAIIASVGTVFLLYRMIVLYPFESYGGNRVYRWNKGVFAAFFAVSGAIILATSFVK